MRGGSSCGPILSACRERPAASQATRPALRLWNSEPMPSSTRLAEDSEVAQEPPQQDENQDRTETATAKLLGAIARGEAAQKFAHPALRSCRICGSIARSVPVMVT